MTSARLIKIKISGTTKADANLEIWLRAANWLSKIVFKTKELNPNRLPRMYYAQIRKMILPSQLTCSLFRTISATYKTQKSNKKWKLAKFRKPVMPIVFKRDFNISKSKGVTLWGEVLTIQDPRPLPEKWKDSKIKRIGKQWYLLLCHEIEIKDPRKKGTTVGVDLGVKRMAVATNSKNDRTFYFHGGELSHKRKCIREKRSEIQSVGTKSSRRLLKRIGRHEAAVTEHLLHVASKALVQYANDCKAKEIVFEDLTNIRDSSLGKRKRISFQDSSLALC